jgi:hypothetical protein
MGQPPARESVAAQSIIELAKAGFRIASIVAIVASGTSPDLGINVRAIVEGDPSAPHYRGEMPSFERTREKRIKAFLSSEVFNIA